MVGFYKDIELGQPADIEKKLEQKERTEGLENQEDLKTCTRY